MAARTARFRTATLQFGTAEVQSATGANQFEAAAQRLRNRRNAVRNWTVAVGDRSYPVQCRTATVGNRNGVFGGSTHRCLLGAKQQENRIVAPSSSCFDNSGAGDQAALTCIDLCLHDAQVNYATDGCYDS